MVFWCCWNLGLLGLRLEYYVVISLLTQINHEYIIKLKNVITYEWRLLFLQYRRYLWLENIQGLRLVKIPWLSGSDFNYTTYLICLQKIFIMCHILLSATFVQSLLDCFICALSKIWEYLNGTKGICTFLHYCLPFWETWKATFFIPYYFIMFSGPRYCFNWENARHFWAETKRILSIITRHLIATCGTMPEKEKTGSRSYFFTF